MKTKLENFYYIKVEIEKNLFLTYTYFNLKD